MKRTLLLASACLFLFFACNKSGQVNPPSKSKTATRTRNMMRFTPPTGGPFSQFISADSANKMLHSYLNSINYASNDSDLTSLIFNADSLRKLLADTSVKNVKLMFAHSLYYINSGYTDQNCGYQAGALTTIVVGYDMNGNYKYGAGNTVLDMAAPCPTNCPPAGTASQNLLSY